MGAFIESVGINTAMLGSVGTISIAMLLTLLILKKNTAQMFICEKAL